MIDEKEIAKKWFELGIDNMEHHHGEFSPAQVKMDFEELWGDRETEE